MGRPRKKGLDYFSFDVDFFGDPKIKKLKARYGVAGIGVYIYLLCDIYRNGYYLEVDEDLTYIIADDLKIDQQETQQIYDYLLKRGLLHEAVIDAQQGPVTTISSAGIQRRFQLAVKERATRRPVQVLQKIWILGEAETEKFINVVNNDSKSPTNDSKSPTNPDKSEKKCTNKSKSKDIYIYTPSAAANVVYFKDDPPLNDAFLAYLKMRADKGDKLTEGQIEQLIKSLDNLSGDSIKRAQIVNEALVHGWKGFYPLKEPKSADSAGSGRKQYNGKAKRNTFNNFEQRHYDKSLEAQLLAAPQGEQDNSGGIP